MSRENPLPAVIFSTDERACNSVDIWLSASEQHTTHPDNDLSDLSDLESQHSKRIGGGADPEDDEELDIDEEQRKLTHRVTIEKKHDKSDGDDESIAPPSKLKRGLNIFKISLLFVVWVMCVVFILLSDEDFKATKLLGVPIDTAKEFVLQAKKFGPRLGVTITGPFVDADDLHNDVDRVAPFLFVRVQRILYDDNGAVKETKNIAPHWRLELVSEEGFKRPPETTKHFVFELDDADNVAENSGVQLRLHSNVKRYVTVKLSFNTKPLDKGQGIIYGTIVLVSLYVLIIWEIVDRTFAALMASTASVAILGVMDARPSMATIMDWIDTETMLLLVGMMVLVAILSESGIFDYLAVYAYQITRGHIWALIKCLCLFAAVLSAVLDNVTTMLLMTPVTIRLCEVTSVNPVPVLMCMVISSNIGAALTPVGDPPNVIIGSNKFIASHGVTFTTFTLHMLPGVILGMFLAYAQLRYCKYRKISDLQYVQSPEMEELKHEITVWERAAAGITAFSKDDEAVRDTLQKKIKKLQRELHEMSATTTAQPNFEETLRSLQEEYPIRNKALLIKSSIAFCFVVALFFLHSVPHLHNLSMGWSALLGAILLLILADIEDMQAILTRVEWSTLLFFASLFILMEALSDLGLIEVIGNMTVSLILLVPPENRLILAIIIIVWVSGIASAFLDNIPVTTMMVKIVISLSQNKDLDLPLHPLVWALAFGACFGGNGTLIGASANVVCAGVAEQHGYKITFVEFFIVGFPVTLGSLFIATLYLIVAHCVFEWHDQ